MRLALARPLCALALLTPALLADVHVVDLQVAPLQPVIDAAAAGDTIVVVGTQAVTDETAAIIGKGLTIIGDVDSPFDPSFVLRRLAIRNLPAGQAVTIAHMDVEGPGGDALILTNNDGPVRFVDVSATAGGGLFADTSGQEAEPGHTGAYVKNCDDVAFMRSSVRGGQGGNVTTHMHTASSAGGIGLHAIDSNVVLYASSVRGGHGGTVDFIFSPLGSDGGAGAINDGGSVSLFEATVRGGATGEDGSATVSGGVGYLQLGAGASATLRDGEFLGGVGDGVSPPGADSQIEAGGVGSYPTPLGTLTPEEDWPVVEGEPILYWGSGLPIGTRLYLLLGFETGSLPMAFREGVLLVGLPLAADLLYVGNYPIIPGSLTVPLGNAPALPPGLDAVHLYVQWIEDRSEGSVTLGVPDVLTILSDTL